MLSLLSDIMSKEMLASSSPDDLVINISDIHHIVHLVIEIVRENSSQDIECDVGSAPSIHASQ